MSDHRSANTPQRLRSPRIWKALALLVCYLLTDLFEPAIYHALAHICGIHASIPNTYGQASFGLRMSIRLVWVIIFWITIALTLGRSPMGFPMRDDGFSRHFSIGLVTGLTVMLAAIFAIWATRTVSVSWSGQTLSSASRNGLTWLFLDLLGATGEEIFGRASILVVTERLLGWRAAILVSGLTFSVSHLGNPGATWIWLLRLFLQGALLAYAVFRTRSLWWSIGYHTGWNWVSAPLFGAPGSGYMDEGHILNFLPRGPALITGGAVGPEGSIFAFLAVLAAFALLLVTTRLSIDKSRSSDGS